jgi:hypothetical protein
MWDGSENRHNSGLSHRISGDCPIDSDGRLALTQPGRLRKSRIDSDRDTQKSEREIMRRTTASGIVATVGFAAVAVFDASPVHAQASGCEQIQKLLQERQAIVAQLNASSKSKNKLTPAQACGTLGRLVNNGSTALKFANANMDWCQIPQTFVDGMKADNDKAVGIRNQACNAVQQQAAMQRRAQQQAQQRGNNPFGGSDAITGGAMRVPQGAL